MTNEDIHIILAKHYPKKSFELLEDHANAFLGIAEQAGEPMVLYDFDKIMDNLNDIHESTDGAEKAYESDIRDNYKGKRTPCVLVIRGWADE